MWALTVHLRKLCIFVSVEVIVLSSLNKHDRHTAPGRALDSQHLKKKSAKYEQRKQFS